MEEYWQLNWSRRKQRSEAQFEQLWNYDASIDPLDVWNLVLNETDPRTISTASTADPTNTNRPFIDPRTSRVIEHHFVDWTKKKSQLQLFTAFPNRSLLYRRHQINGLKVLGFAQKEVLSEADQMLVLDHTNNMKKISAERKYFHSFVKQYVDMRLSERFAHPAQAVVEVGRASISGGGHAVKYLDSTYAIQTGIQLESMLDHSNASVRGAEIVVGEELQKMGVSQTLHFVSEVPMVEALPKCVALAKQFLVKDPEVTRNYNAFIGSMGRKSGGTFLTSDIIYHILSADSGSAWTVPFLVQSSDSGESYVYFEGPCQKPLCLSALELERMGLRVCYHAVLSNVAYRSYSFDEDKFIEREEIIELMDKKDSEVESDKDEDDEEEARLVIIDPEESEVPIKETPKCVTSEYKLTEFDEYLAKYCKSSSREPVNYLVNRVQLKLQANPEPLSLVVTSSCDGLYRSENVALSFKFEYKSEFGAQKMGLDELLREWCSIAFTSRINQVVRVRVDYGTSLIMSVSQLKQEDIEQEMQRLYQLKPESLLTRLYNVLNLVTRFPVGKYLLDKELNNSQILVYMETERNDCGKVWKDLMAAPAVGDTPTRPSFIEHPIDDQIVTQLHRINGVIPGCIPSLSKAEDMAKNGIRESNRLKYGQAKVNHNYKNNPGNKKGVWVKKGKKKKATNKSHQTLGNAKRINSTRPVKK